MQGQFSLTTDNASKIARRMLPCSCTWYMAPVAAAIELQTLMPPAMGLESDGAVTEGGEEGAGAEGRVGHSYRCM